MHQHRVDDDLFGDLEEVLIEGPDEDSRVLSKVDDLDERLGGKDGAVARFGFHRGDAFADDGLALGFSRHHKRRANGVDKPVGAGNLDRLGCEETMTMGHAGSDDAGKGEVDDLVAEKRHDPTDRTREVLADGTPTLGLRP